MKTEGRRTRAGKMVLGGVLLAMTGMVGCGTYFDLEKIEKRKRKKDRANGYREEPSGWETWKEWERVKYRDWFRRMTDD